MRSIATYSGEVRTVAIVLLVTLSVLLAACQAASGTAEQASETPSALPPTINQRPALAAPTASAAAATETPVPLTATDNGLSLSVTLSAPEVAPGGSVTIDVTVRNDRPEPVVLGPGTCGTSADMYALLPVPLDPIGRDWSGIAAKFKHYALTEGMQPGIVPMSKPIAIDATATPCFQGDDDVTLQPDATLAASLTWSAFLVQDVPALPGDVPFTVSIAHDPQGAPPSYPPGYEGPGVTWFRTYEALTVSGTLRIVGDVTPVLSAGQAIDAMLSNKRFESWLSRQPRSTWSNANVFLQNYAKPNLVAPAGPSWDVELYREVGVSRNWAIGAVEAHSGKVLNLEFCNAPCNR